MPSEKPKTQFTITEAHRITGKSRTTIQKHIKNGKLSFTEHDGVKFLSGAELARVYPDDCDFLRVDSQAKESDEPEDGSRSGVRVELHSVRQQLDAQTEERRREREQLQAQIDHLQDALATAQSGQNRVTMLLEQRSSDDTQWRDSMESVQRQVTELKNNQDQEIARLKRALKNEREKGFWKKLLGR